MNHYNKLGLGYEAHILNYAGVAEYYNRCYSGVTVMRQEIALKKLVEYVARKAALLTQRYELEDLVAPSIAPFFEKVIDKMVVTLVKRNGGLRCNLCDKGPFTKRGMYLHLIRVHSKDIEFMVHEELRKLLEVMRK